MQKSLDRHGRWRNLTIAFRVSPEENDSINLRVKLSGLTKQEYICRRCQQEDVVVVGNPRVYKALKTQLEEIDGVLRQKIAGEPLDESLQEALRVVTMTLQGLQTEEGGAKQ